ncbi:MAG TPA: Si-specific NAD(P)(+) transhydrogenase [Gemmatimonadales bacterium]|nr:Si-specific NAD(P)(+) transhydrogenase [Gemmatimonadales bacterium]
MEQNYHFDFVCIGSGPAGQRAAVQAAKLGSRVAIVEKCRSVGGVCLDTGTIPSKTIREAVLSFSGNGSALGRRGIQPPPDADHLLERVAHVVSQEAAVIDHQLRRNGVEVISGHASFLDPHTLVVRAGDSWREITAKNILIAVGTVPTPSPGMAPDGISIVTSDDIVRLPRIPKTLTVVGAGVIGTEYASIFAALGVSVTLVDKRRRPLEFLDEEIVDELLHQLRRRNLIFRPSETVDNLGVSDGPPQRVVIHLESGKRIVSDMALFSVGRMGATAQLDLHLAGLKADDRGRLKVDDHFRTTVPHIYAAGDVIGHPSLAATSSEQGRLAACYALGNPVSKMRQHFPIGIYSIPEISMVGEAEHELTSQKIPYEVGIARYREIARGQILGDDSGFFKMLFHREDRRLLGVHIIGTGATELLHIGQTVLGLGGGLDYFMETVFNYPTLAECYKVAALNAANKLAV